jgi:2'-5' RNA ligase
MTPMAPRGHRVIVAPVELPADHWIHEIALHDELYTGPLAHRLVITESYQPHVTIGRIDGDADRWRRVVGELAASAPRTIVPVARVISYRRELDGARHIDLSISL